MLITENIVGDYVLPTFQVKFEDFSNFFVIQNTNNNPFSSWWSDG